MSIEDDIKNVQELIDGAKRYGQYEGKKYYISMEHIISDYMMLKEIEKEHRKINGNLRKEIEALKEDKSKEVKECDFITKDLKEYINTNPTYKRYRDGEYETLDEDDRAIIKHCADNDLEVNIDQQHASYLHQQIKATNIVLNLINKLKKQNDILKNHVHYKECQRCGKEFRAKRNDARYCDECKKDNNKEWYKNLTKEQKEKRRKQAKICMRKIRERRKQS